ncbi:hypothetical protein [Streptomyces hydrogenans]|uniref:hypothetical protein n=1 Tax=Streptomyces hydrogenans TaxID=1873719 RepID=UPI0038123FF0
MSDQTEAQPLTQAERRQRNLVLHRQARLAAAAARGPAGIAAAWMDEARAAAKSWQAAHLGQDDADAAWNELAATLAAFCRRYGR